MPPLLRLMRPHQYAKNLLVFAAPGAAGRLDDSGVIISSVLAFVLFCAVSSIGYIGNDILDADADRQHPVKRNRPIASGEVTQRQALGLIGGLAVPSLIVSPLLGLGFLATLLGYAVVTLSYSSFFKRIPWLELIVVSSGFVLRAVGGGTATSTSLSTWFLVVVSAGSLLVITGKRLGEFVTLGADSDSRKVLSHYSLQSLRSIAAIAATLAAAGYAAWAASEATNQASTSGNSTLLRLTVVPFAVAIARYLVIAWQGSGETPESVLLRDRVLPIAGVCWTIVYALGRYL